MISQVLCTVYWIFTYKYEALTLSQVLEDKIEATEMSCLRRIGNIKEQVKGSQKSRLSKYLKQKDSSLQIFKKESHIILATSRKGKNLYWQPHLKGNLKANILAADRETPVWQKSRIWPTHSRSCCTRIGKCHSSLTVEEATWHPQVTRYYKKGFLGNI